MLNLKLQLRMGIRWLYRKVWELNGYIGPSWQLKDQPELSVLFATYNENRVANFQPLVNNILKCGFVKELLISNHNPELEITNWVDQKNNRLKVLSTEKPKGCSYRWTTAQLLVSEHVLILDDDILIFPWQIRRLYRELLRDPSVPHGFAGAINGRYLKDRDCEVDDIYEAYMVTKAHISKFSEYENALEGVVGKALPAGDFLLISRSCPDSKPKIHNVGRTLRCFTSDNTEIAVHRASSWKADVAKVRTALQTYLDTQAEQS